MSAQEIIRELAKLNRDELTQVDLQAARAVARKDPPGRKIMGRSATGGSRDGRGPAIGLCRKSRSLSAWATASMKAFADAVYFIALLSTRDRWHARAIAINRQPPGLLVTTEWVLTEVGDAFSQPGARQQFIRLLDLLRQQPDVEHHSIYKRSIPTRYGLLLRATR